jgi:streptogramin lyase
MIRWLGGIALLACSLADAWAWARGPADGVLARYDLSAPPADRWQLPKELDEVSGLAIDRSGRIFAHGDERAAIYQLDPATHQVVKRFTFGRPAMHGDFEAIAFAGDRLILSTSDGILYLGSEGRDGESVPYAVQATGVGGLCEVEGLAYSEADRSLLLACKTPRTSALRGRIAVFAWSVEHRALAPAPRLLLPLAPVARAVGASGFNPSELVRDPATGHFLFLAGRERAIAELTPDGRVVQVSRLRHSLHRQPEGLAIAPDGALLVADEANGRRATLTVYPRSR